MTTWHERLRIARDYRGFNKSELARGAGVSNPTVTDWESGNIKKLEAENLLNICEFLGISSKWLLHGKGEMLEGLYVEDPKAKAVLLAMQQMPEYKKDMLVAASNTLAEQPRETGTGTTQ